MNQSYGWLVSRVAIVTTAMAFALLLIKISAWWYTGSVSTLAVPVDSLVDIIVLPTNLLAVHYSLQPTDEEYIFGYDKAESLAALVQSVFTPGSALFLFLTDIQHLVRLELLRVAGIGAVVTLIALFSTLALVIFQRQVVRKTQSQAVRANMLYYQSDVIVNGAILVVLGPSWYGWYRVDALFVLGIGICTLYSALRVGYEVVQSLLDRALPDEERQDITTIVTVWPGIRGAHDLRTRQSGPTCFIQTHLEMEDNLPLAQAHVIVDQVEQAILRRFLGFDVIIHQDPSSMVPAAQQGFFERQVTVCKLDVKMWGRSALFV